jgi:hypothetical protein
VFGEEEAWRLTAFVVWRGLQCRADCRVNIPINAHLLAGLSAGYTFRGQFDKEAAIDLVTLAQPTDTVKPGDSATVTGTLGYAEGAVAAQGSGSYSWDTASLTNGIVAYRSGQRLTVTFSGSYAWNDQWKTSVIGLFTHALNNDQNGAGLILVPEPFDSNANHPGQGNPIITSNGWFASLGGTINF